MDYQVTVSCDQCEELFTLEAFDVEEGSGLFFCSAECEDDYFCSPSLLREIEREYERGNH